MTRFLSRLLRVKYGLLLPLASISLGLFVYLWQPSLLVTLRNSTFDQFQRWHPRVYRDAPVRVIDIDEESLRRLGQWPWPRTKVAELLSRLQDAEPAAIAFDFIFPEADRTSPEAMANLWSLTPSMRRQLMQLPDHDQVFARTVGRGGVILGFALETESANALLPRLNARYVVAGDAPQPYLHAFASSINSIPPLADAAAGSGAITFIPDSDGVVRKVPLVVRVGDTLVPSLTAEALRVAQDERNFLIRTVAERGVGVSEIRIGSLVIPTTPSGEVWVAYSKPVASRYIPAWKVMNREIGEGELSGKILLVGTSAQGLMDLRFSPMGGSMPGVEAHAQLLEQVLTGGGVVRPSWGIAIEALIIVVGGLAIGSIALANSALVSFGVFASIILSLWGIAWTEFSDNGLLLDATGISISLAITFVFSSVVHHLASESRQRWIKQAFARYVSPNLVTYMLKRPESLELGGRRQECSFVFTDLAGFTTLMESMDPGAAVKLLNNYLDHMIAIAFSHQGTLDRIVGDAVAIMFSAPVPQPDHQRRALACAMEMQRFSSQYVKELANDGVVFGQTRIGIHSGEVIVGNFGGSTIFDYRALGDPVNTASRLEGANKYFGTLVCVSEVTLQACPEWLARPIGRVLLKGKTKALAVFEPLDQQVVQGPDLAYEAAFRLMSEGRGAEALSLFEILVQKRPDDALVAFHLQRLRSGANDDLIVLAAK